MKINVFVYLTLLIMIICKINPACYEMCMDVCVDPHGNVDKKCMNKMEKECKEECEV